MPMTKKAVARLNSLMPNGVPKYIRCYDNGGTSFDQYTVCFTGKAATERMEGYPPHYPYRTMSAYPSHLQGFGFWCYTPNQHCDVNKYGFAPAIGRKTHWGAKRIPFSSLPTDCQKLILSDYKAIWKLN